MKILTNIRFYPHSVAGITQYLIQMIRHNEREGQPADITGVDVAHSGALKGEPSTDIRALEHFHFIQLEASYPPLSKLMKTAASLDEVRAAHEPVIRAHEQAIAEAQPDVIIMSGTYAVPWCLLQAARRYGRARLVVHYHGLMSKEVESWEDAHARELFLEMERDFDAPDITYVFPSALARRTVEEQVIGHALPHAHVLPNPVPEYFFESAPGSRDAAQFGAVCRWSNVKGTGFLVDLARRARETGAGSFNVITHLPPDADQMREHAGLFHFYPPVRNELLPGFFRRQGAVVMASRFETYGNIAQESLACGTPAVASAASGVAETYALLGLERWVDDFSSVDAALARLSDAARSDVPAAARAQLRAQFTPDAIFPRYRAIIGA